MSEIDWQRFDSTASLDESLAEDIAQALAEAIDSRNAGTLAVSGGSTPIGVFKTLSAKDIDWSRVTLTLVDDRWVDISHEDSNELLVNRYLRKGPAEASRFVSLHTSDSHPREGQPEIETRLAQFATLDVVMLGMGGDGHFASLFPDSASLAQGLDRLNAERCIAVDPPAAPHARMSMTLPRILDSRWLVLHITGDDKRMVLEEAARTRDAMALPIASVLESHATPFSIYWAP